MKFSALHNHSHYSLLDSACRIDDLVAAAVEEEMEALALTDKNTISGAVEFTQKCRKAGLKPITGCEIELAGGFHLVLLAASDTGYANLCRLLSRTENDFQPVSWKRLSRHADGLIALSGCRHGEIPRLLAEDRQMDALPRARAYAELFPNRFYIELFHHLPGDPLLASRLTLLAEEAGLPLVATPNTHYRRSSDFRRYQVLASIRTLTLISQSHPAKKPGGDYHFKSTREMRALFSHVPGALENTLQIARQCQCPLLENAA